jgi:hypothetical protein
MYIYKPISKTFKSNLETHKDPKEVCLLDPDSIPLSVLSENSIAMQKHTNRPPSYDKSIS